MAGCMEWMCYHVKHPSVDSIIDLAFPRRPYDEALREAANWFRERYPAA